MRKISIRTALPVILILGFSSVSISFADSRDINSENLTSVVIEDTTSENLPDSVLYDVNTDTWIEVTNQVVTATSEVRNITSVIDNRNGTLDITGTYIGSGKIRLEDGRKVTIKTYKNKTLEVGDSIKLVVKGTFNKFTIQKMYVNDVLVLGTTKVIVKAPQPGIFTLSGMYDWKYLDTQYGKVRLIVDQKYKDLQLEVKVKDTFKNFRVLAISVPDTFNAK